MSFDPIATKAILAGGEAFVEIQTTRGDLVGNLVIVPETEDLVITDFQYEPQNHLVSLTWNSVPGRVYAVDFSGDLNSWIQLDDGIESDGSSTTSQIDGPEEGTRRAYYRIRELDR